ncbi:hypothetical protein LXA43DRAFT_443015 [Ganoderma leucocontextum]|nr:hypothetical protein LXA43DRAFT_443015 [Ganoderma leucocontextum]
MTVLTTSTVASSTITIGTVYAVAVQIDVLAKAPWYSAEREGADRAECAVGRLQCVFCSVLGTSCSLLPPILIVLESTLNPLHVSSLTTSQPPISLCKPRCDSNASQFAQTAVSPERVCTVRRGPPRHRTYEASEPCHQNSLTGIPSIVSMYGNELLQVRPWLPAAAYHRCVLLFQEAATHDTATTHAFCNFVDGRRIARQIEE